MNKLQLQYYIFLIIVFVSLTILVTGEKISPLMVNKIDKKLDDYIKEQYKLTDIKTTKTTYKDTKYQKKVINKSNDKYYFIIYYNKKKITDTYKEDYIEGKTFLKYISKSIENNIYKKTNNKYSISINNKLDKFTDEVKNKVLKEDNLESLSIYTLSYELKTIFDYKTISKQIIDIDNNLSKNNINPKSYEITITNNKDITKSINIKGINRDIIKTNNLYIIISDIISNKKSTIIEENNITFEYLN